MSDGEGTSEIGRRNAKPKLKKQQSAIAAQSKKLGNFNEGKIEILSPIDSPIGEVDGVTQSAATNVVSKIVSKITGHTSDSQKAAIDSINTTVSEMGKLAEGMSAEEKLKLAEKMAEAGKGAERVNEDNNSTWAKIGDVAIKAVVTISALAVAVATKGKILKDITKA